MSDIINEIKNKFTKTYNTDGWYMGDGESKSGLGSSLRYTENFREELISIIKINSIDKVFDCSCGDWNWMKTIKDELPNYVGNDVVEELIDLNNRTFGSDKIKFICGDMLSSLKGYRDNELDLVICRHTLEHLPTDYSLDVISEIKKKSKYAIITSTNTVKSNLGINMDGVVSRGLNMDLEPYVNVLGEPIYKFYDSIKPIKEEGCFGYLYKF